MKAACARPINNPLGNKELTLHLSAWIKSYLLIFRLCCASWRRRVVGGCSSIQTPFPPTWEPWMGLCRQAQPSFPLQHVSWEWKEEEKAMTCLWFFRSCTCRWRAQQNENLSFHCFFPPLRWLGLPCLAQHTQAVGLQAKSISEPCLWEEVL